MADRSVRGGDALVEDDLVLRNITGRWWNARELEHAEGVVVLRPRMPILLNMHEYIRSFA